MWAPIYMRKIFVGGIDYSTTDETLRTHFSQYGDIVDAVVMKDTVTSRSRGFGFVTFSSPEEVDTAQKARPHKIDGRLVETKRAMPKSDTNSSVNLGPNHPDATHTRIFIGGLPQDVKEEDLERYFGHFGSITCVNIMYDKSSGRHRGFAFVDFNDYDPVDKVLLTKNHIIKGRPIDVKKAISKSDISKLKSLVSGGVSPEASFALSASLGHNFLANSLQRPANSAAQHMNITGNASFGSNGSLGPSPVSNSTPHGDSSPNPAVSANQPPTGVLSLLNNGHPHLGHLPPRLPFNGMPGFSTQLRTGWQYSVSQNAEVLRNTAGAPSDQPSGAPPIAGVQSIPFMVDDDAASMSSDDSPMEDSNPVSGPEGSTASTSNGSDDSCPPEASLLILEPFYGGSHKQLVLTLRNDEGFAQRDAIALLTLPSKKWHWKARTSALYFSQKIPQNHSFKVLFASSVLNLCELVAMRPDLALLSKVLYFHENQLVYPVQRQKERDFQYGYNQILSCLIADKIVFNSQYNLESFMREVPRHLKHQPKPRPDPGPIVQSIKAKSTVLYFPVNIKHMTRSPKDALEPLHIIWPHRWEHDKDPDTFFQVLFHLANAGLNFRVSVLGQSFSEIPPVFAEAKNRLSNYIQHWGFAENKDRYWEILHSGDVVISTAHHEFFGVAMLEGVGAGCFPLCPNRLVYPEIFPQECLYNTQQQLEKSLSQWCVRPQLVRSKKVALDLNNFSWKNQRPKYAELLLPSSSSTTEQKNPFD